MDILTNNPRILQAHCQSRTSQHAVQSFVKELAKPTQDKIVFKKFPTLLKKIKNATHSRHGMTQKLNIDNGLQGRWTEGQLITAPTKNWRFSASYDSFVVAQTFVLRMNIYGKNRQLLVAAKRYGQAYRTTQQPLN